MVVQLKKHQTPPTPCQDNSKANFGNSGTSLNKNLSRRESKLLNLQGILNDNLLPDLSSNIYFDKSLNFFNPSFLGELSLLVVSENISTVLDEINEAEIINQKNDYLESFGASCNDYRDSFFWDTKIYLEEQINY